MKMDLNSRCFQKKGKALVPADIFAEEFFDGLKEGSKFLVRVVKPRNIDQHRKLFAMLRVVVDNSEDYASVDILLEVVKLAVGYYDIAQGLDGEILKIPRSISFGSMPQDEFGVFFLNATYVMSQLSGIPESVLLEESNV